MVPAPVESIHWEKEHCVQSPTSHSPQTYPRYKVHFRTLEVTLEATYRWTWYFLRQPPGAPGRWPAVMEDAHHIFSRMVQLPRTLLRFSFASISAPLGCPCYHSSEDPPVWDGAGFFPEALQEGGNRRLPLHLCGADAQKGRAGWGRGMLFGHVVVRSRGID